MRYGELRVQIQAGMIPQPISGGVVITHLPIKLLLLAARRVTWIKNQKGGYE